MAGRLVRAYAATRIRRTRLVPLFAGLALTVSSTGCLHRGKQPPVARRYPSPSYPAPTPPETPTKPPAQPASKPPATPPPIIHGEEGIASWYGRPYHGRKTSSGEIYNMYAMTAAHRTLPFGTRVKVHNLENGNSVEVRINDRGPFVEGRIIDLSYTAAQGIHMPSTALVRLEILGGAGPEETRAAIFAVQIGAFKERDNAERLKQIIEPRYAPVTIQNFDRGDGLFYRVLVGQENSQESAQILARSLREANFASETFVVRLN